MKRAIAKMFPSLEDALETQWEQIRLGSGKKVRFLNGDALFKLCNILG